MDSSRSQSRQTSSPCASAPLASTLLLTSIEHAAVGTRLANTLVRRLQVLLVRDGATMAPRRGQLVPERQARCRTPLRLARVGERIVHQRVDAVRLQLAGSMSMTFELRRSGQFSLNVRPRMPTCAPFTAAARVDQHLDASAGR